MVKSIVDCWSFGKRSSPQRGQLSAPQPSRTIRLILSERSLELGACSDDNYFAFRASFLPAAAAAPRDRKYATTERASSAEKR